VGSTDDVLRLLEPLPGIDIPRDPVAVAAATLNASASPPFLANHAFRSFAWASWFGRRDGIEVDRQQLWVAGVLHDIGLTSAGQGEDCFEVAGGAAAAAFLQGLVPEAAIEVVRRAIVLHMQPRVGLEEGAVAYLLDAGVSCDVSGRDYEALDPAFRDAVLERFPRHDFKRQFTSLIAAEAARRPDCMAATYMNELGLSERVAAARFAE